MAHDGVGSGGDRALARLDLDHGRGEGVFAKGPSGDQHVGDDTGPAHRLEPDRNRGKAGAGGKAGTGGKAGAGGKAGSSGQAGKGTGGSTAGSGGQGGEGEEKEQPPIASGGKAGNVAAAPDVSLDGSGCGCAVPAPASNTPGALALGFIALVATRRRRR